MAPLNATAAILGSTGSTGAFLLLDPRTVVRLLPESLADVLERPPILITHTTRRAVTLHRSLACHSVAHNGPPTLVVFVAKLGCFFQGFFFCLLRVVISGFHAYLWS